jgi:hypothetical protein
MFALFKLCAFLVLAAPFASALTITSISGNVVSEGSITITWTTATTDPAGVFSIELDHPSFNSALAIATNVDSSNLQITIALPNVPAQDGYTIEFVDISDINTVYTVSSDFAIGAVSATMSTTVTGASSLTTSSASVSASASKSASGSSSAASVTPISTKPAPSTSNTGFGTTASESATAPASISPSSSPSPTGSSGALSSFGGSRAGALLVALGVLAGAFAV